MGIFDRFPYSSTHEMNLDFMLGKATEIAEDMQTVTTGMAQVQAGLSAISEKTEQATQAAAQAAQSASSIEGSVTAAEEAAEEAQRHNESAQTWANNAMTYKADCQRAASEAAASSTAAAQAATAAAASEDTVATYAQAANASAQSAANNNDSAHQYANQASASASNATFHSSNAQTAATNANTSATNAETAATNAQTAATRASALKDDCQTLHSMCTTAVDLAGEQAVAAANSAAQAAATKTDVENLVESLPEDFTDLNNTVNQLSDDIDKIDEVVFDEQNVAINWAEYGSTNYPLGWRLGRYNDQTGASQGSTQFMRVYKLIPDNGYDLIRVKPLSGRYITICEYTTSTASAETFVNGKQYNVDEIAEYPLTEGHYYGVSQGYWTDNDSESYITPENIALMVGTFYKKQSFVSQDFGNSTSLVVSQKAISEAIAPSIKLGVNSKKLGRFLVRGISVSNGSEYELNFGQFVRKNWEVAFSGNITSFSHLKIGLNYKAASLNPLNVLPRGLIVDVSSTTVTVTRRNSLNSPVDYETILAETLHNITIADYLQIVISGTDTNAGNLTIECNGEIFSSVLNNVEPDYYYCPFVEATDCIISNADFSFSCKDFAKDILIVGDSYTRNLINRWPYYLHENNFDKNVCINGHGGAKSYFEGGTALEHLLNIFTPKYVLWCLGMNDESDTDINTPSVNWIRGKDKLLSECEKYGCIPVFATIPNVNDGTSVILHDGKNKWIRDSGYQYIDFAKAVGADENGEWREGLRESSTGLHPSSSGAKVLYMQAITDFPQLTISN